MSKFVNPFTDYGFKLIFGSEVNKDLIIDFLNGVLQNEVIIDITFRNVEMLGLNRDYHRAVFDIFCESNKGEFFIVEIQKSPQKYFSDRVLYYASFAIQQQTVLLKEKERKEKEERENKRKNKAGNAEEANPAEQTSQRWRYEIRKVYVVCILNYIMEPAYPEKYRWDIVRMDRELKVPFSETLNEVYLEMPKFVLPLQECDTVYKKWLYVLNNIDIMERLPQELNNQIFRKLKSIVELERMTPNERLEYEISLSAERDLYACLATQFEEGEAKGLKEGEAKGKKEGLLEGMRQVARNMKLMGMDQQSITKCTGLDAETIAGL